MVVVGLGARWRSPIWKLSMRVGTATCPLPRSPRWRTRAAGSAVGQLVALLHGHEPVGCRQLPRGGVGKAAPHDGSHADAPNPNTLVLAGVRDGAGGLEDHALGGRVDHMLALLQHLVSIDQHLFHLGCVNVDQGLDPAGEVGQHTLLILGILAAWLSSLGGLNIVFKALNIAKSTQRQNCGIKMMFLMKNKVCGGPKRRPDTARLSSP